MNTVHKILIIDDDETTCFINRIFLEEMQVADDIECFYNATEALLFIKKLCDEGSFQEKGPDLIFLDINMPGVDGFEFLEKVKKIENLGELCSQRIVMYTSSGHPKDIERAHKYGVLAYVLKPLTEPKLKSVLEAYYNQAS